MMADMDIQKDKVMILKMYISRDDAELRNRYLEKASEARLLVEKYLNRYFGEGGREGESEGQDVHIDCGFDLFCPDDLEVESGATIKVNMRCKCAMTCMGVPCGFYLYPRSSVGAKTPLRLANSVGIIDSGYRGDCIAVFDNRGREQGEGSESGSYHIAKGDRLVQICSGNLLYPIYPIIVDSEEELGDTMRGVGGFGSTGR